MDSQVSQKKELHSFLHAAPVGMLIFDEQKRLLFCNAAAERLFKKPKEELEGLRCGDFIRCVHRHEDSRGCGSAQHCPECLINRTLDRALRDEAENFEDGGEAALSLETSADPVHLQFKVKTFIFEDTKRAILSFDDITERKNIEEALRKSENRYRALFEKAAEGVVLHDNADGTIINANEAALDMFGYTLEEFKALLPIDLVHPDEIESVREDMGKLNKQDFVTNEHRCIRKDGSELIITLRLKKVSENLIQAVLLDVTRERELEEHRKDVERIMRHDLRTPLTVIITMPQMMEEDPNLTAEQRENLKLIQSTGDSMLKMIDSSLDLFKIEEGSYEYLPDSLNAVTVINTVISQHQKLMAEKKICSTVTLKGDAITPETSFIVDSDETLLIRLISNLFKNAVEASPHGENVRIDLNDGSEQTIQIINRGAVPDDMRNRFFAKYATSGKRNGTGIGTYSAKLIADVIGCSLTMSTSDTDDTTLIEIRFPPG